MLFKSATYLDNSHVGILEDFRFRIAYKSIYNERHVLE